jgi:hypothetical protein
MTPAQHWQLVAEHINDASALEFLRMLNDVVNVWDDVVDGDNPAHGPADVGRAFELLLVHIPRNAFYQRHRAELQPVIEVSISDWHAANHLQRTGDAEMVTRAHTLRFSGLAVWILCCRLCRGQEAANRAAVAFRTAIPAETSEQFASEVRP